MIMLEDVSALELLELTKCYGMEFEKELLVDRNILNYQQIKNLVDEIPYLKETLIGTYLDSTLRDLDKYKDREPNIFNTIGYDDERLEMTDSFVFGSSLLLSNPTNLGSTKFDMLNKYTIKDIKFMLSHTNSNGINALVRVRNVCNNNILKIVDCVRVYEEQVIRQASETSMRYGNLFELHNLEKKEIVRENFSDIILYLIYNTNEELIWGNLSDTQKRLLISSAINNSPADKIVRENMINVISNYTTLGELEKGIVKSKVLNRFIKK